MALTDIVEPEGNFGTLELSEELDSNVLDICVFSVLEMELEAQLGEGSSDFSYIG